MTAQLKKGFTLIELLIVMAILGVLAVVVLVAINPAEQLARARDSGRVSAVNQLGRALSAYYTAAGAYPDELLGTWDDDLVASQDISSFPSAVSTTDAACSTDVVNGYCYDTGDDANGNPAGIVFSELVSQQQINRCPTPATDIPYSVFSSYDGRGGLVCGALGAEPTCCGAQTFQP